MNHAMDITQERVINPVRGIAHVERRLRALIRLHIEVVLSPRDREITVMLHETIPSRPPAQADQFPGRTTLHSWKTLIADVQKAEGQKETQRTRKPPARPSPQRRGSHFWA